MSSKALVTTADIPGAQKAAILMLVLGEQLSGEIFRHLEEEEISAISRELARISSITSEDAEKVLEECHQMSLAANYILKGGLDYARKILINAFGPEQGKKLLDRVAKAVGADSANFDMLQKADPQQLARFIHNEHPQTIALILSHLNASQAAALLHSLPGKLRPEVALRMAHLDQISPEIINRIAALIGQKLKALGEYSLEAYGGVRAVAEMFNRLDSATSKEVLEAMEQEDPGLVEGVRNLMFVFEDILMLSQQDLKEVLSRIDRKVLTVALKGTSERLQEHFMQCMSQRGSEMLREDMDALGAVKIKEVEAGQQQIIAIVRQLESEGVISLRGTIGEQYVL